MIKFYPKLIKDMKEIVKDLKIEEIKMSKEDWDAVVKLTQAQHNVTQSLSVLGSFENLIKRG